MTLTLELSVEQQQHLAAEAARRGMATETYAIALLTHESPLPLPGSLTPEEMVAYWKREGILRPQPELPDSPVYARQLRDQAQKRQQP